MRTIPGRLRMPIVAASQVHRTLGLALASAGLLAGAARWTDAQSASARAKPPADDAWMTDLDRKVLAQLTGVKEAGPLVVHFRPGDLAPEVLAADVAANGQAFDELQRELGL